MNVLYHEKQCNKGWPAFFNICIPHYSLNALLMNSTKHLNQLPLETELPPLRIAYKNAEVAEKKTVKVKRNKTVKAAAKNKVTKEPLPLFNDYKFKAKDYDPL